MKVLGSEWDTKNDTLLVDIKDTPSAIGLSKRIIVSFVASIFDILGYCAPVIIRAKIGIQRLWELRLDWDGKIPNVETEYWNQWFKDVKQLNEYASRDYLRPAMQLKVHQFCVFSVIVQNALSET